jgi:hypothetical protein
VALTFKEVRRLFQVPTRGRVRLGDYAPGWAADKQFKDLTKDQLKARAAEFLQQHVADLADAQERLYASDTGTSGRVDTTASTPSSGTSPATARWC